MKQTLVLLSLVAIASAAWKGGLRARFEYGTSYGKTSFYDLPRTIDAAVAAGYTLRTRAEGLYLPSLKLYCPSPAALCLLYDDTGYIAGMQVGVDSSKFTNYFDLEIMGMKKWTTDDGTYWIITEYFVSEEFLAKSSASRVSARDSNTVLQAESVWVTGTNGDLYEIPRSQGDIGNTKFLKEACMPWMGRHYYYNMSPTTECTSEGIFPWFPMYESKELIGVGFMNFGQLELTKGARDWFERPSQTAVKAIVPSAPQCLYDLSASPGALTMHTYFIDQPWMITCIGQ